MIQSLNQQAFRDFGTILPDKEQPAPYANHHSLPLLPERTVYYQTAADTWLKSESGSVVLSVSADGEAYRDFYLDKPVRLHGGVWFSLVTLQGTAAVQMSGFSMPRHIGNTVRTHRFEVRPQVKVEMLYTFLYQEKEQGFLFTGEAHPMTELVYVDRGSLHSVADGQDLLLEQGDMVIYKPGQWHMQYADIGVAPRFVTMQFDAAGCDLSVLGDRKFPAPQKAVGLLQQMLRELEQMGQYATDMILSLLQILLLTLLRELDAPGSKPQLSHSVNAENAIIRAAQQYITGHVREKLSVPVVAKNAQVSPSYLTALFHKHLQISPGEYIRRIKLQESKQMIREGNMNFTEISEMLQYSTVHHFSRQFKEKFGITPTEYAKSVR